MDRLASHRIETLADIAAVEPQGRQVLEKTRSVVDLLAAGAAHRPAAPALIFLRIADDPAPVTVSFAALMQRIHAAARLLRDNGIGQDDVVSILLPAIPQAHFALWGGMAAGIANPMNILLSRAAIAAQLRGTRTKLVIALGPSPATDLWQRVAGLEREVPSLERILQVSGGAPADPSYDSFDVLLSKTDAAPLASTNSDPRRIAALFHTGGSTGAPRVVKLSHRNLIAGAWSMAQSYGYSPEDLAINGLPLFHVAGAIDVSLSTLAAGCGIVLPTASGLRNPDVVRDFWKITERFGITIIGGVPTSLAALANVPRGGTDLSRVTLAITGGSSCPSETAQKFEAVAGVPLHEVYGMTECAGVATANPRHGRRRIGSAGMRVPLMEVFIAADGEPPPVDGTQVLPTASGEIWLRGPNVFSGYLDPQHDVGTVLEDGWIATGDLGRLDADGYLWITGRKKDIIIRGAHNIDPLAIEEIAATYPGVVLAAAVGQPDAYAGEVPVLYVTAMPNVLLDTAELMAFIADRITEPPARPREIFVVPEMPLTPFGKIFKPQLRIDAAQRAIRACLSGCHRWPADGEIEVSYDRTAGLRVRVGLRRLGDDAACAVVERAVVSALSGFSIAREVAWRQ